MLMILSAVIALAALVCFVIVVIKMFQHGKTGPGLASALGFFACGLGYFFALIYGWMKAGEWRMQNLMIAWTVLLVLNFGLNALTLPAALQQMQVQMQAQQEMIRQQNAAPPTPVQTTPAPAPVPVPAPAQ